MLRTITTTLAIVLAAVLCGGVQAQVLGSRATPVKLPDVIDLRAAQEITLRDNPSLGAASARVAQAIQRVRQARSSYYPQVDSGASAIFTEMSNNARRSAALLAGRPVDDTLELYEANLTATWLLFDGLGREHRTKSALADRRFSQASYREAQRFLLSAVATVYYGVLLARENIAIAQADEAFNRRQLLESDARRRVGTGSLSDTLNFEVRVRSAQTALLNSERAFRIAVIALAELMALPEAALREDVKFGTLLPEQPHEMQSPGIDSLVGFGLTHRPDLVQSQERVAQSQAGVGIGRSEFYPLFSAFGSLDAQRNTDPNFQGDDVAQTVGLSVTYNIFSGGRRRAALLEAKAAQVEAEQLLTDTELRVASEIRQARQNLVTSQQQLVLQQETTGYVERNRDLVDKEYQAGQGSLVRLNEAQRDLISQQSRLALARVALRLSWHELQTATGETLEAFAP